MKKVILTAVTVILSQWTFAQTTREVGDFTSIKTYDKIPVTLVSSSSNKVEISGNKSESVKVVNNNGELKIRMETVGLLQGDDVAVKVYYKNLNDIQASQGSSISSEDRMKAGMLSITANEGSAIDLDLNARILDVKANTGGIITLTGSASHQTAVVNTGANYDGERLKTKNTKVTVNAGGNASVYASQSVDAKTRAGGKIVVYGNPKENKSQKVLGGNIDFK